MRYVDRVLRPDEEIIASGRMHWIIYLRGAIFLCVAVPFLLFTHNEEWVSWASRIFGALLAISGLGSLAAAWIEQWTTEIAVTPLRVIQKRGLIWRQTGEMNMQKVESVTVDQSVLGRLLNYGTINVRGTGTGIEGLRYIADPLQLRSAIVAR